MPSITYPEHFALPSPLELHHFKQDGHEFSMYIKRDDLIHPQVSGNKWRKLKYNVQYMLDNELAGLATCGGPWSNHLYATASAAQLIGCSSTGFIRGDYYQYENSVLQACRKMGMQLIYLPNKAFDTMTKSPNEFLNEYQIPGFHFVPLGGSNDYGSKGCREIVYEVLKKKIQPELWVVAAGTATTALGMLEALDYKCKLWVFPAVGIIHQKAELEQLINTNELVNVHILPSHRCKFGKIDDHFRAFIKRIQAENGILFDPLYNGKMLELIFHEYMADLTHFKNIVLVHTGGLSGWEGFRS